VRRALGASKLRLLQQLLAESLVLAMGGGICGVVLALWTNELLRRSLPSIASVFAVQLDLSLDWRVIAFATGISVVTTVLCGLLPAWRVSQARGLVALKGDILGGTSRRRPLGLVAQVVMSFVLLFVAGSFLQALLRMQTTDPGFKVAGRLYAYTFIPTPPSTRESGRAFYAQAIQRLMALPGVRRATLSDSPPLMPGRSNCASLPAGPRIRITAGAVDTGFFETMGIDMVAGRDFATGDLSSGVSTVIVNESLARRLSPDKPVVGERLMIGCDDAQAAVVIGIVRNSAVRFIGEPAQPHLYRPFAERYSGGLTTILLETSTAPAAMMQPVRRTLLGLGQGIRIYAVQPLSARVEESYWPARWQASVFAGIGLLALLLAAIGLYGVIAYRVTLRTQEIGVRMALGARREDIFREVVSQGLAIVLVGVAIGEVLTATVTRVVASMQVDIRPTALSTHVAIGLIWIAVALVACYVPAARAARVNPLVALRYE
jgi:putative ABC transport system permease protein